MPKKNNENLADLVQKYSADTHHLRCLIAPEMFHAYCQKMDEQKAAALTCAILQITHAGLEVSLRKDRLGDLKRCERNQKILEFRAAGYSFALIAKIFKISRVQIWRILSDFTQDVQTVEILSARKVRCRARLTKDQLESIERMKKTAGSLRPKRLGCGDNDPIYFPSRLPPESRKEASPHPSNLN